MRGVEVVAPYKLDVNYTSGTYVRTYFTPDVGRGASPLCTYFIPDVGRGASPPGVKFDTCADVCLWQTARRSAEQGTLGTQN